MRFGGAGGERSAGISMGFAESLSDDGALIAAAAADSGNCVRPDDDGGRDRAYAAVFDTEHGTACVSAGDAFGVSGGGGGAGGDFVDSAPLHGIAVGGGGDSGGDWGDYCFAGGDIDWVVSGTATINGHESSTSLVCRGKNQGTFYNLLRALSTAFIDASSMLVSTPAPHRVLPSGVRMQM